MYFILNSEWSDDCIGFIMICVSSSSEAKMFQSTLVMVSCCKLDLVNTFVVKSINT